MFDATSGPPRTSSNKPNRQVIGMVYSTKGSPPTTASIKIYIWPIREPREGTHTSALPVRNQVPTGKLDKDQTRPRSALLNRQGLYKGRHLLDDPPTPSIHTPVQLPTPHLPGALVLSCAVCCRFSPSFPQSVCLQVDMRPSPFAGLWVLYVRHDY